MYKIEFILLDTSSSNRTAHRQKNNKREKKSDKFKKHLMVADMKLGKVLLPIKIKQYVFFNIIF